MSVRERLVRLDDRVLRRHGPPPPMRPVNSGDWRFIATIYGAVAVLSLIANLLTPLGFLWLPIYLTGTLIIVLALPRRRRL